MRRPDHQATSCLILLVLVGLPVLVLFIYGSMRRGDIAAPSPLTCIPSTDVPPTTTRDPRLPTAALPFSGNPPPQRNLPPEQPFDPIYALTVQGSYAYVGKGSRLEVLSLTDPAHPTVVARSERLPGNVIAVAVMDDYAYVGVADGAPTGEGKLYVFAIAAPRAPQQVAMVELRGQFRSLLALPGTLIVATEPQPTRAHPGKVISLQLFAVADPTNPRQLDTVAFPGSGANLAATRQHLYVSTHSGLRVFNIADTAHVYEVTVCTFDLQKARFMGSIFIADGTTLYTVLYYPWPARGGETVVLDISNPALPVAQAVITETADLVATQGHNLYLASRSSVEGGNWRSRRLTERGLLRIMDVRNPRYPVPVGEVALPLPPTVLALVGDVAYVGDGRGGMQVAHIADATQPAVGWFGTPMTPALAGKVVFTQESSGGSDILAMYPDGSGAVELKHNLDHWDMEPALSPDGNQVAFRSVNWIDGATEWDIYVMNLDGTGRTNLTNTPGLDSRPAWSPDGKRIVFQSSREGSSLDDWDIYVMQADGSQQTRLTDDPAIAVAPVWSPDGTRIAFTSYRDGNGNIYSMQSDGSQQAALTNHPANDQDAAWSPDGRTIAFQSSRDARDGEGMDVFLMQADGTAQRNVTRDNGLRRSGAPAWSPNGTQLVFHGYSAEGTRDIYVMNLDGTGMHRLTDNEFMNGGTIAGGFPDWGR